MNAAKTDDMNPFSLLLSDEQRIVLKTRRIREEMVDDYLDKKDGDLKIGEVRELNGVMDSLDNQVLGLVDKRLRHEDSQQNAAMTETIAEALLKISSDKNKPAIDRVIDVSDKVIPVDLVPGEDTIEYEEIEMNSIIKPR